MISVQYTEGGGGGSSIHRENIMITVGDIMRTPGDIMINVGEGHRENN